MITYTKDKIFSEIFKGTKFRSTKWKEDKYIEVKKGQIIDNKGDIFNLVNEKHNEWMVWTAPKPKTNTMTREEALQTLYKGKRVKAINWDDKELQVKNGQIFLNDSEPFNIMTAKETDWIVIETCEEPNNVSNQFSEIKTMLEELLSRDSTSIKEIKINKQMDGRNIQKQASTNELLTEVYGVNTPKKIQTQFKKKLESANNTMDIQKTVCEYIPYCWIGDRRLGTTSVYYSDMRKIIKEIKNKNYRDIGLSLFLPPDKLYETVQTKISDNKKEEIRNKNTFDLQYIKDMITKIKNKLLSDDFTDKPRQTKEEREKAYWAYAYLTIVTGRRQAEILKSLELKKVKGVWQYCGIAKDREDNKCINAYTIDEEDYDLLSDLTDYIQEHINADIWTLRKINSKFNNSFNNALKRITGTTFKASDWRDIYAEILWIEKGKKEGSNIDKRDFKAKVLGHKYDHKLSATEHYDSWEAI